MVCPGSVRLIERLTEAGKIDPRASSGAADEGTAAHQIRSDALDLGLDAWDFVGDTVTVNGTEYLCDDEMARHLQPGIDWIRERTGELIVEHRVRLDHWMPGQFGTLDTAVIDRPGRRLIVSDLKYGAGVPVDAEGNRQLRIYALGIIDNFDLWDAIDEVLIVIDQPRAGGLKEWPVSLADLLAFGEEVRDAALAVDDPNAPLVASEKGCRFCEVKNTTEGCPAYTDWMLEIAGFDDLDDLDEPPTLPDTTKITPERRWYIVQHANLVEKWFAKLHEDSIEAARAGTPDPGSKLVLGRRGNRRYMDESEAETFLETHLGDQAFTRKVISPAQAEKLLKPTRKNAGNPDALSALERLVTQDEGKPILVPEADPRDALPALTDGLDDLDDL